MPGVDSGTKKSYILALVIANVFKTRSVTKLKKLPVHGLGAEPMVESD